ncbi:MAG TPA: hypothetical protein VJ603_00605 [Paucimonas sp.]|nr:hypothetical protein [Paucimonas sp.]HJW54056.1 hypothetical protein [Burkholderiaceae bacterium]
MSSFPLVQRVVQIIMAAPLCLSLAVHASESSGLPKVFTFAAGYRSNSANPHNLVEFGVLKNCGKSWCIKIERFDGAKELPRVRTDYKHEMHAPYRVPSCQDDPITTIKPDQSVDDNVNVQPDTNGFSILTKAFHYHWIIDTKLADGYLLADITPLNGSDKIDQIVGFAFASNFEMKGDVAKTQLMSLYKGEIYHKTALTGVSGEWKFAPSSIDFRRFNETDNGHVLILSQAGDSSIVKKYGKPMWVQNSIVLARSNDTIAPLTQEYGHDFNMDGCFNESGHNKLMLPISDGENNVRALIYVEYTPDNIRGFPMLSVGRYYR